MKRYKYLLSGKEKEKTWNILETMLKSDGHRTEIASIADEDEVLQEIYSNENLFKINDGYLIFATNDPMTGNKVKLKDKVMSKFVESCLRSDEDLQKYIKELSVDTLMDYFRLWNHKTDQQPCVFVPEHLTDEYIQRLGLDAITHVMVDPKDDSDGYMEYEDIRNRVSKLSKFN